MKITKLIIFSLILFAFSSCENKELGNIESQKITYNSDLTKEIITTQNSFDITDNILKESFDEFFKSGFGYRDIDCVEITKTNDFGHFPNTFTLDFGNGCDINDSLTFSGKIIITMSGFMNHTGDSTVYYYDDFYVNNNQIEGKIIKKNLGKDQDGNRTLSKEIKNAKITHENGDFTSYSSLRYIKYYKNGTVFKLSDDELGFIGNFNGTSIEGDTYEGTIKNELILPLECGCLVTGEIEITINSQDVYTLNYGEGTCDNTALLEYPDGTTEEIEICK